jgi:HlyD family secretion protein
MKFLTYSLLTSVALFIGCSNDGGGRISATGTLEATEITISSLVGGTIVGVNVEEGMTVALGDTIAVLDPTDWRHQLRAAEAGLEMTEAQYKLAIRGAPEEDIIQAEANYKSAESDLQRMEELWETRSISQKQLEDMRTRYTLAQQTLEKLRRGSRAEEVQIARARRDQAAAQVASLKKRVADCTIIAPIHGTITKRFIEPGENCVPGMAIARLADLREMNVTIYILEAYLPNIKLGQEVSVMIDAFPNRSFPGNVVFLSSVAEFTPKNIQTKEERTKLVFAVKIKIQNPDGVLKAGIPADVMIRSSEQ